MTARRSASGSAALRCRVSLFFRSCWHILVRPPTRYLHRMTGPVWSASGICCETSGIWIRKMWKSRHSCWKKPGCSRKTVVPMSFCRIWRANLSRSTRETLPDILCGSAPRSRLSRSLFPAGAVHKQLLP